MRIRASRILMVLCFLGMAMCLLVPTPEADAKKVMKYYCIAPPFSPVNKAMELMKDFMMKETNGDFQMQLFPSGQLGPENQGLNNVMMGAVQSAAITGVAISQIEPKANLMMLPYVFKTWDDVETFANSDTMAKIGESLEKKGLKLMGVGGYGFFNVLAVNKFVSDIDDYNGLKIRVYPTPILIELYKILNASPTPVAFPEIYTALQQGVIEATDGTLDSSYASKQYEVAKYLTQTKHLYGWFLYLVNKSWYEKLPGDTQQLLTDAFAEYSVISRQETRKYDEEVMAFYAEQDVKMMNYSEEKRNSFLKNTYNIHKKYEETIGTDLLKQFYKELNFKKPI